VETSEETLDLTRATADSHGVTNIDFTAGDVHHLDLPDDTYDVVHAHQVLQHIGDPVQALQEMRRVCKPEGLVAARDSDYSAFAWYPQLPELDEWMTLYQRLARANGGEPDAGRRLLSWAHAAGFDEVEATASTWCFSTPEDRDWWGRLWADRIIQSDLARQARESGVAEDQLLRIAAGWRTWAESPDGWLALLHGEILAIA
jgi:SAM-dependent methyltransferase